MGINSKGIIGGARGGFFVLFFSLSLVNIFSPWDRKKGLSFPSLFPVAGLSINRRGFVKKLD